jgi:hypothetical protein
MTTDDMPVPALEDAIVLRFELGPPLTLGRLATGGVRSMVSAVGGTVEGAAGTGIVAGGRETRLTRADGVTTIDATYLLVMADGAPVRLIGTGYVTDSPDFQGTRMTISFEVDENSPRAWLATRIFLGERPAGTAVLHVAKVL